MRRCPSRPRQTAAARRAALRHVLALAKRSLIKTWRTPEALIDVTLQPVIFLLLFTYIFGGAIAGGSQARLPAVPAARACSAQSIAMAGVALGQNLNTDIEKGVFDRFRSLPIARSAPLVGAVARRHRALPRSLCVVTLGFGYLMGFRVQTGAAAGAGRGRPVRSPSRSASAGSRCSSA